MAAESIGSIRILGGNMDNGTLALVVAVLTAAVVGYLLWKRGGPVTLQGIVSTAEEAAPIAQELAKVAEIGVQAAEQLFSTGRLPKDDRLDYALNYVKSWSPALQELDNAKVYAAIESAVLVANALRAQAQTIQLTRAEESESSFLVNPPPGNPV